MNFLSPSFTVRCWLFGHEPDEDLRHSLCSSSDKELTFCTRCCALFHEEDGEWVRNNA